MAHFKQGRVYVRKRDNGKKSKERIKRRLGESLNQRPLTAFVAMQGLLFRLALPGWELLTCLALQTG